MAAGVQELSISAEGRGVETRLASPSPRNPTFCDGRHILGAVLSISCDYRWMEAIMPSLTKLAIGTTVALVTIVGSVSAVGSAVAQEVLINRHSYPASEMDFRLSDHQKLRKYFVTK
jgi:hypothetical protein